MSMYYDLEEVAEEPAPAETPSIAFGQRWEGLSGTPVEIIGLVGQPEGPGLVVYRYGLDDQHTLSVEDFLRVYTLIEGDEE